MLGHDTPEQTAPDGAHVHTIHTVGNRATGDMLRWEHCDTCPRETDIEAAPETVVAGWAYEDTDRTTTYVRADFTVPPQLDHPYDSQVRHGTDDEYLDMFRPLDEDEDGEYGA